MCQINNVLHNTGNKPLTCYKVLRHDLKRIRSPYYSNCSWILKETKRLPEIDFCTTCIGYGFFHAFTNKADTYAELLRWTKIDSSHIYIIAKMEIPPYTDYYTGITDGGIKSIATQVITFKRIL